MLVVLGSRARIALLVAVAILALQQESAGAVLTVTTADDAVATNGFASLREAIVSINDGADVNADVTAVRGVTLGCAIWRSSVGRAVASGCVLRSTSRLAMFIADFSETAAGSSRFGWALTGDSAACRATDAAWGSTCAPAAGVEDVR